MNKLILLLLLVTCHMSLVTVCADTPLSDLRVTNSLTLKSGATSTEEAGAKKIPRPAVAISALDIDWRVGNVFSKTLAANSTFTFSNVADGTTIVVSLTNTASNYTVTWPAAVKWSGGTQPTQTVGAKVDVWTFIRVGSVTYGSVVSNFTP